METLLQAIAAFAGFVVQGSLKASVLVVLVLLVQRWCGRQLSAAGQYLLWVAVVASLLVPGGVGVPVSLPSAAVLTQPVLAAGLMPAPMWTQDVLAALPPGAAGQGRDAAMEWAAAWPLLWLAGVLVCLAHVLVRQRRFARLVRAAQPASSGLQQQLEHCRRQAGCRRNVALLVTPQIDAPLVTGVWRPVLLLPLGLDRTVDAAQLQHVFLHELVHVRRHDIATNWLLTMLQALHWFNPLLWVGFARLRLDRELACDAATLRLLADGEAVAYGRTLLQLSQPRPAAFGAAVALGIVDGKDQLRRRLDMLVRTSTTPRRQAWWSGALLLVLGTLAFSDTVPGASEPVHAMVPVVPQASVMPSAPLPVQAVVTAVSEPAVTPPTVASGAVATAVRQASAAVAVQAVAPVAAAVTASVSQTPMSLALADTGNAPAAGSSAAVAAAPAPAPAAPAQPDDVIVIIGRSLREKMLAAERMAYDVFNKYNDNPEYRISCSVYIPTGTRLERQTCKPGFELTAEREHGIAYLQNMQGAADSVSPVLRRPLEAVYAQYMPGYQRKLKEMAAQHPDFLAAIKRYSDLKNEYLGQTRQAE